MTTREDFNRIFEIEDSVRKETHTLESIEATGCEEPVGDVVVTGFVFYPNALKNSRFSVIVDKKNEWCFYKNSPRVKLLEGSLSLDALELLVDKEDFEDFLGLLHDVCSDFNVDDESPKIDGNAKYVYETVEWFNDEPEYIR
jgi:hypothetical protein